MLGDLPVLEHDAVELDVVTGPREVGDWSEGCGIDYRTIDIPFRHYRLDLREPMPEDEEIAVVVDGQLETPATVFRTTASPADGGCGDPATFRPDGGFCDAPLPCPFEEPEQEEELEADEPAPSATAADAGEPASAAGTLASDPDPGMQTAAAAHEQQSGGGEDGDECRVASRSSASPWLPVLVALAALGRRRCPRPER